MPNPEIFGKSYRNTYPSGITTIQFRGRVGTDRLYTAIEESQNPTKEAQADALTEGMEALFSVVTEGGIITPSGKWMRLGNEIKRERTSIKFEPGYIKTVGYSVGNRGHFFIFKQMPDGYSHSIPRELSCMESYLKAIYRKHCVAKEDWVSPQGSVKQLIIEASDLWGLGETKHKFELEDPDYPNL